MTLAKNTPVVIFNGSPDRYVFGSLSATCNSYIFSFLEQDGSHHESFEIAAHLEENSDVIGKCQTSFSEETLSQSFENISTVRIVSGKVQITNESENFCLNHELVDHLLVAHNHLPVFSPLLEEYRNLQARQPTFTT